MKEYWVLRSCAVGYYAGDGMCTDFRSCAVKFPTREDAKDARLGRFNNYKLIRVRVKPRECQKCYWTMKEYVEVKSERDEWKARAEAAEVQRDYYLEKKNEWAESREFWKSRAEAAEKERDEWKQLVSKVRKSVWP